MHKLLFAYLPVVPATIDTVATRVVVALTIVSGLIVLAGKAWNILRRAARLLDHVERLPGWMDEVDTERRDHHARLEKVENLAEGLVRGLDVPVRRRPRGGPRPAA